MTQFDLTADQLQIQEMARKFTADAITPFAAEWDEKHIFPRDTIREAAELGSGALYASAESAGGGGGGGGAHLPGRHERGGGRARLWRDLRQRGERRDRARPARGGADHGS